MPTGHIFKDAYETVRRSVDGYKEAAALDALSSIRAVDFEWTLPDVTRDEVEKCLFSEPQNRIAGNGGDWWSVEDNKYSQKLWEEAAAFSDTKKNEIVDYVIKEMNKAAAKEKRKAAAEEKAKAEAAKPADGKVEVDKKEETAPLAAQPSSPAASESEEKSQGCCIIM